jgi:hypothetical protein
MAFQKKSHSIHININDEFAANQSYFLHQEIWLCPEVSGMTPCALCINNIFPIKILDKYISDQIQWKRLVFTAVRIACIANALHST